MTQQNIPELAKQGDAKADEQLNYSLLLVTHIICADQQIHSEESKALYEIAKQIKAGRHTIEEMEKILAQDEYLLSVEDVARRVPFANQSQAMRQILAIAYIDGFFSPLEREMVKQVAQIWNWSVGQMEQFIQEAENSKDKRFIGNDSDQPELSLSARLLMGAESVLSRSLVNKLAEIAPENVGRRIEELQQEILLAGPEYDHSIQQCAAIASEDYIFAELALKRAYSTLYKLAKNLQKSTEEIRHQPNNNSQATTAKEVAQQLENTRKSLTVEIIKELKGVRESLSAKQRSLNHFSIAFMGKTKAGKSTLHAIITGGGWDAIGVGKQRTTRFNRVYEWKNIRIIDTPGIGAPGGKTDEEIAQSVIEESDVICYVVTNDSIQETEFQFLKLLKEKAKPLIVILNIKNNLHDSRRLDHFLKDPEKLFAMDGKSGLSGHIERIRRYARQHYTNDYFDIVPVLLLAAQLSCEPKHQQQKNQLFKASRIQSFLDSIRVSLVEYGTIRRSQTLLGSTVGAIDAPSQWVTQQAKVYQQLTDALKNKRETIQKQINVAAEDNCESLLQQIATIFQDALNAIPLFAEDHWNLNPDDLNLAWEKKLNYIRFDERLKTLYEETSNKFTRDVREAIEEVSIELQLMAKLDGINFSFTEQDSSNLRDLLRIGGNILLVAGTVITFFAPPVGIAIGIAATVVSLSTGFFKSKDEKRRKAVQNISTSLTEQLSSQKQTLLQQTKENFDSSCNSVSININTYFDELIIGIQVIAVQIKKSKEDLDGAINYLNRAYAKRIIEWCSEQHEPLTHENINRAIAKVKRDFGRSMNIQIKSDLKLQKSQEDINCILQENVSIQTFNSTK